MKKPDETLPAHEASPSENDASTDNSLGRLQGAVTITGDIESPVEPAESWEVCR